MLARLRFALAAAFAITAVSGTAVAQSATADLTVPASAVIADSVAPAVAADAAALIAGPTIAASAIAARPATATAATAEEASAAMFQSRGRRGGTLMIIGGAALLAGVLVGDDVGTALSLGGAIVGLYGLYLWLQ